MADENRGLPNNGTPRRYTPDDAINDLGRVFDYADKRVKQIGDMMEGFTESVNRNLKNSAESVFRDYFRSVENKFNEYTNKFDNQVKQSIRNASGGDGGNRRPPSSTSSSGNGRSDADEDRRSERQGSVIGRSISLGLEKFLNIWLDRFTSGINKISSVYESTYSSVSVLMNQNQSQYMAWQRSAMDEISRMGLKNNVAISEVMTNLEKIVRLGLSGSDAQQKALSDTITNKLNPYLDTSTNAYTDLQMALGSDFVTAMRGIPQAINQNAGSTRVTRQTLDKMLTELESVGMFARKELYAQDIAGAQAMLDSLVSQGTITTGQATEMSDLVTRIIANPTSVLTGGSAYEASLVAGMSQSGVDLTDASSVMRYILGNTFGSSGFTNWVDVNRDVIGAYAFGDAMGGGLSSLLRNQVTNESLSNAYTAASNINAIASGIQVENNLARDQYNTVKQLLDTVTENMSLDAALFKEKYPDAYDILQSILRVLIGMGISGISQGAGNLASRVISSLRGGYGTASGGSSAGGRALLSGAGRRLATAGGITLGVGEVLYGRSLLEDSLKYQGASTTANTVQGVGAGVGIAGGAVGATALGSSALGIGAASGPVGWAALAIGGVALTVSKIAKDVKEQKDNAIEGMYESNDLLSSIRTATTSIDSKVIDEVTIDKQKDLLNSLGISTEGMSNSEVRGYYRSVTSAQEASENTASTHYNDVVEYGKMGGVFSTSDQNLIPLIEQKSAVSDKILELAKDTSITDDEFNSYLRKLDILPEDISRKSIISAGGLSGVLSYSGPYTDAYNKYGTLLDVLSKTSPEVIDEILGEDSYNIASSEVYDKLYEFLRGAVSEYAFWSRLDYSTGHKNKAYSNISNKYKDILDDYIPDLSFSQEENKAVFSTYNTSEVGSLLRGDNQTSSTVETDKYVLDKITDMQKELDSIVSSNNISYEGTHKSGLDYVPYDGYQAILHKGEAVLTAEERESFTRFIESMPMMSDAISYLYDRGNGQISINNDNSTVIVAINNAANAIVNAISKISSFSSTVSRSQYSSDNSIVNLSRTMPSTRVY